MQRAAALHAARRPEDRLVVWKFSGDMRILAAVLEYSIVEYCGTREYRPPPFPFSASPPRLRRGRESRRRPVGGDPADA